MKIAYDTQLLMKGEKTGIAWCAENILQRMPQYLHDSQLNCFALGYDDEQFKHVDKYTLLGYQINKCNWFHDAIYRIIWSFLPVPYSLFFPKDADITMFFNYVIPPGVKGRKVTIVYDMAYKACPETVRKRTKIMLNISLKRSCKRADKIITISEFSKSEIIRYLGIDEDRIVVMPCGVDFALYHTGYTDEEVNTITAKYNINSKYLLYLGTLEPRKNIDRLIQAYAQMKNTIADLPKLVLAGRKGWMYDRIFMMVKENQLENDVIFTGYIDSEDTPVLMKGAEVFLFPSLYEGFGMPPIEAMACGTPVLVSNVASLPEVVGDAGILVDPLSVQSIQDGIELILKNESLRVELSQRGLERAKTFSWDRSVEIVAKVFEELR